MTPEEAGKDLVVKLFNGINGWHTDWMHLPKKRKEFREAKQAAIVCCNEIINNLKSVKSWVVNTKVTYWQQVKQYLNN